MDPPKVQVLVRVQVGILPTECPAGVPEAWQPSKLQDEVRFLGGALGEKVLGVWRMHATLRRSKTRFDSWRGHYGHFRFWIFDFRLARIAGERCLSANPKSKIRNRKCHDAGARRPGGCLQSSPKRVRLPPASLTLQLPVQTTSLPDDRRPNQFFVEWS